MKIEYAIRFFGTNYKRNSILSKLNEQYLFKIFISNINRENLALPSSWNQMTTIKQFQIKPETIMIKGKVGPQFLEGAHYISSNIYLPT